MKCQKCKRDMLDKSKKLCVSCTLAEQEAKDWQRYEEACHAMQSGVAACMDLAIDNSTEAKHLRVGINVAMCDLAALVELLSKKGVFELHEYAAMVADKMEAEKKRYEEILSNRTGKKVTLI